MNRISRMVALICGAIVAFEMPAAELLCQPDSIGVDSAMSVATPFNALDYLLQRPAKSRYFENKRFGDHLFLTLGAGPQWNHKSNTLIDAYGVSPRTELSVGDWFTPVHGIRLQAATGWNRIADDSKIAFGTAAVDYLMDFSALVAGYNPQRKVEMLGIAGVEAGALYRAGSWTKEFGARIGLQLRYNFSPSTFFYVEPRFGIYNDGIDRAYTWQRYDWQAAVMFGFGYRITPRWLRRSVVSPFENDNFRQNIFYGVGFGALAVGNRNTFNNREDFIGAGGSAFIGKMFSSTSGLRLQLSAGYAGRGTIEPRRRKGVVVADVDYQLNLNSAMNGYDPQRRVELNFLVGPTVAFPSAHNEKLYLGVGAGLQGVLNLNDEWGLFIEPFGRVFSRGFAWEARRRLNLLASMNVGFRYRIGGYNSRLGAYNTNANYDDFLQSRHFFMSLGGGVASRGSFHDLKLFKKTAAATINIGRWFSPESAWRLGANYAYSHNDSRRYMSLGVSADYMLNISSLSVGWNDARVIDVIPLVGVQGSLAHYHAANHFVYGVRGGVDLRFNVSPTIAIFVEPTVGVLRTPNYNQRRFNPEATLMAGIVYKLGNVGANANNKGFLGQDQRNFLTLSGGPGMFSETILHSASRRTTGAVDLAIGHWLSHTSALQAGVGYDYIPFNNLTDAHVTTLHADYLLDLSQAMAPDTSRLFSIMAKVGGGLAWSRNSGSKPGISVEGGLRFNWRVDKKIDLFLDPTMTLWQPRLVNIGKNTHHYVGVGRVMAGAGWRF